MTPEQEAALAAARSRLSGAKSFNPAQQAALEQARARIKSESEPFGGKEPLNIIPRIGRGADGSLDIQPSKMMTDMGRAFTAPGRAWTDPNFDAGEEARNMALNVAGGGMAISKAGPALMEGAGVIGMNVMPPVRAAGRAVASAASTLAEPLMSRANPDAFIGKVLSKRAQQQNPNMTPAQSLAAVMARDTELGPQAVLADTGEAMKRTARNMAQGPGETSQRAKDVLGARQEAEKTRMIGSLKENISGRDFYDVDAEADLGMKAAGPHFKAAFKANPAVISPVLDKLLNTPAGKDALSFARQRVQNRMARMANPDKELTEQLAELVARGEAEPSKGGVAAGLKLETHDLIRQDLYDQMQLMKKKVAMGTARKGEYEEIKNIYNQYRQELLNSDATAKAGPNSTRMGEYEKGLEKYKDAAKLQEALEEGRSFVRGDPEDLAKDFGKLGAKEQDAYRTGVVKEFVEMIGRDTSDRTPAQLMASLKAESSVRKKLATIAPSQAQFNKIMSDIERELAFRDTAKGVQNVSQTGSIAMEEGQLAGDTMQAIGGATTDVLRGRTEQAFATAMNWAVGQLRKLQMPQDVRDRIGRLLLSQDPKDKEEAFRLIQAAQKPAKTGAP